MGYAGTTTRATAVVADVNEVMLFRRLGNQKDLRLDAIEHHSALPHCLPQPLPSPFQDRLAVAEADHLHRQGRQLPG